MSIYETNPKEIEKRSFEIITEMLGDRKFDKENDHIIKRCIHTSADFDYADNLYFSEGAVEKISNALLETKNCNIFTDTKMAKAGINKEALSSLGIEIHCFISDEDVIKKSIECKETRAAIAVEKAASANVQTIFVVGNAPTALIKIYDLVKKTAIKPVGIIAVPVGFVNVIESKELIMELDIPCIVAKGRKGGSNIAAAICNAILYDIIKKENL